MKVTLRSSGGIRPPELHPPSVDTSRLSNSDVEYLQQLLEAVESKPPEQQTGPDRIRDAMTYIVTIETDEGQRVLRESDANLTPAFEKLMNWFRTHAAKP